jgi:predicted O-methyltransferase YrrM
MIRRIEFERLRACARKARGIPRYLLDRMVLRTWILYLSGWSSKPSKGYSLNHLKYYGEIVVGPVQRDEALFLYSLVVTVDPKTLVEFGFHRGHSAINFLKAMSPDAMLCSYDISDDSAKIAGRIHDKRFRFTQKSQADFEWSDVDNRPVDLAFFDAAHDSDLNMQTFDRLQRTLSDRALVVVHDTGRHCTTGLIHQPDERRFVNHVKMNLPGVDQVHLHSTSKFRHGLTLMQRNVGPLALS